MRQDKNLFYQFSVALSVMAFGYILIVGVSSGGGSQSYPYEMKGFLILLFFLVWTGTHFLALLLARLGARFKTGEKKGFLIGIEVIYVVVILSMAFAARYAVITRIPMEPASDYKTYYEIARLLKEGTLQEKGEGYCNYIAMFPHIIGYCYILKHVFVMFGTSVFHGQLANVFFSVGTVFLLYRIGKKLGGRLSGVIVLTAAAFWPSQILYVNMLAAEYSFSFFFYLSLLLFLHLVMDYKAVSKHAAFCLLLHIFLGCLLAVTSAIRPMALILLIAMVICVVPQNMKLPNIPKTSLSVWVQLIGKGWIRGLLIVVSYFILSSILTTNIELTINQSVPSMSESSGYNLLVGLNVDSAGGWNEEDSKFLYENLERTGSPVEAQRACREKAVNRLSSDLMENFKLFVKKYELLWGNDDYGTTWNLSFLKEQGQLTPSRADFLSSMQTGNHMVYMVTILFSFMTLIYLLYRRFSYLYLPVLIFLGTAAIHVLVESQNRYHYHVLPAFMIIASVGMGYIFENARGFVRSNEIQKEEKKKQRIREEELLRQFEEEEHQAIETRYKTMTNSFDMDSAIQNGNVTVTVSEKYKKDEYEELLEKIEQLERENKVLMDQVGALIEELEKIKRGNSGKGDKKP